MEVIARVVDDLDRLFRHLVLTLAQESPEHLGRPFQVAELYQSLVPYRQHRSALGLHSHQDYEMAILRLLAGEKGYATVEPPEVQQALAQEAQAIDPDTGAFREYAAARVRLNRSPVETILNASAAYFPAGRATAPSYLSSPDSPTEARAPEAPPAVPQRTDRTSGSLDRAACGFCATPLPADRNAVYCPFCGVNLGSRQCRRCGAELEPGWRYCIDCGSPIAGHQGSE